MEFEWKIFQDLLHWAFSKRFKVFMIELKCEPELFEGRIIFMPMYIDIIWVERGNTEKVRQILLQLRIMLADSRSDVGHFWVLDQRRNGAELILINKMENATRLLNA